MKVRRPGLAAHGTRGGQGSMSTFTGDMLLRYFYLLHSGAGLWKAKTVPPRDLACAAALPAQGCGSLFRQTPHRWQNQWQGQIRALGVSNFGPRQMQDHFFK